MTKNEFISTHEVRQNNLAGCLFEGVGDGPHYGILVLHGAGDGGGYEQEYARYLAAHGYTAFCVEYFGTAAPKDALSRIPISYFKRAAEWLIDQPDVNPERVGVVGFSRGGEVALLVGAHIDYVVVGYVPSGLVFPAPTWMDGVEEEVASWACLFAFAYWWWLAGYTLSAWKTGNSRRDAAASASGRD